MMNQKILWKHIQQGNLDKLKSVFPLDNVDAARILHGRHQNSGDSVVHLAARHGFLDILIYFVKVWKIGLQLRNLDNKMPLHDAAASGHTDIVQYLLDNDVPVDCLKKSDWTPLMLACTKENNIYVMKLLIEKGANICLVNKDGWNCFHLACRTGDTDVVRYLLRENHTLWNSVSNNGRTPLHTAALHGKLNVVDILIQCCDFNLNVQDSCGSTPLNDAIKGGNIETAKILLQNGADVHVYDKLGRSCLHTAAEHNQTEAIKYLVQECNIDPDVQAEISDFSKCSKTAIHWAYKERQWQAIYLLKELGANEDISKWKLPVRPDT